MLLSTSTRRGPGQLIRDEEGQSLVEYAFVVMLVALVCVGALTAIGFWLSGHLSSFAGTF